MTDTATMQDAAVPHSHQTMIERALASGRILSLECVAVEIK